MGNSKTVSGVLCHRIINVRVNGKAYKTVVRLAMMYGVDTFAVDKAQYKKLDVAEMEMLRFLDRIRNERIEGRNVLESAGKQFFLTTFNKIVIQGTLQMAVDKEAICLSRVYSYYFKCNLPLFYV